MSKPTVLTLKANRDMGRVCGIVERFIAQAGLYGVRKDLFGFIDIIAIDPKDGIIGIQSCGMAWSDHVKKIQEECQVAAKLWLSHAKAELWGWRKVKLRRGSKAVRWKPRVADLLVGPSGEITVLERSGA